MSTQQLHPRPLVILDAGHGCDTAGRRSPLWPDGRQLFEWELNRDLARRTKALLAADACDVHLLVPEADDLSLPMRLERAINLCVAHQSQGGTFCQRVLVSIHANASPGPTPARGWECFAHGTKAGSRMLAAIFLRHALRLLPDDVPVRSAVGNLRAHPGGQAKTANFYMLKNPPCVTLLTENLFMNNPADCSLLLDDDGRQLLARLHADALREYLATAAE